MMPRSKLLVPICVAVILWPISIPAQNPDTTKTKDSIIEFQSRLATEATEHRKSIETLNDRHQNFLEWCYTLTGGFLVLSASAGGAAVMFLNFKSKKDIEEAVERRIKLTADRKITEALRGFENELELLRKSYGLEMRHLRASQDEFQAGLDRATRSITTISQALTVLGLPDLPPDSADQSVDQRRERRRRNLRYQEVLSFFGEISKWLPTNRHIGILHARIFVKAGNLYQAVQVLTNVLKAREELQISKPNQALDLTKDPDHAALLYNKACYLSCLAKAERDLETKEGMFCEAWNTLAESAKIDMRNYEEALNDDDFDGIESSSRNWARFKTN